MGDTFANNRERIAHLVENIEKIAASMRESAQGVGAAEPEANKRALNRLIAESGGIRTVAYNLARVAHDELLVADAGRLR